MAPAVAIARAEGKDQIVDRTGSGYIVCETLAL